MLNLPFDLAEKAKSVLFLGIGGGHDIYSAMPVFAKYRNSSLKMTLANVNSRLKNMALWKEAYDDMPESFLAEWLPSHRVYGLPRTGVQPLQKYLRQIVDENQVDYIVCVDGGVDSLMSGDEEGAGTFLEDTVSMIAAHSLGLPGMLMCLGFGTETDEGVCHHYALEKMAKLIRHGAFIGSCSLVRSTDEYAKYEAACLNAWGGNTGHSHIHTKVISAVKGSFGDANLFLDVDPRLTQRVSDVDYINPLMGVLWFFDLEAVLAGNLYVNALRNTGTNTDVLMVHRQMLSKLQRRPRVAIPL
mgnify:CR=1 FL=1